MRSAERSPPPARPKPVEMARVVETGVMVKDRVRSAERLPPPDINPDVFMALVVETAVILSEIVGVPVAEETVT